MPSLKMNIIHKDNIIYTTNKAISFIVFNVSADTIEVTKKSIHHAYELLKKNLLKDKMFVDKKLFLITEMKKKRLLHTILSYKKIPIQATYVYMLQLV